MFALALLVAGALCVATGALSRPDTSAILHRILPLLLFLGTVIILAELTGRAQTFDVVATRLAIAGRGRYGLLFALCVLMAVVTTVGLNLDTTAVLLTPIMLAMAARVGLPLLPLAMTTVLLANTASLLLPVGNLTNLLAADRVTLNAVDFAARMATPEAASVAVTMAVLWFGYWSRSRRGGAARYELPEPFAPRDRVLCVVAGAACMLFVGAILLGAPLGAASAAAAAVTVAAFALRERAALRWSLLPWRLLATVTGMFLVVQTITVHGLGSLVAHLVGASNSFPGQMRAAGTGALLANLVNNLPAYVAGESAVPAANHGQLLALLIGVNVGPVITAWASLATLLWYERCAAFGLRIPKRRTLVNGVILAVLGVFAATAALAVTG
ncbi:arsenic transporter [Actinocrinis puniceicyclus]|uniref:Arsenic transporter n=1 Tax=Actinocrinis puniceicyclus TaxID=977794 RepID=A0A8J7WKJ2_9ACTN|nr:SLC13 family permease [Actinocrinis puniceicyclus]MBS2961412.1 arsenic transporter [Actinocrinis puniceicyclus]